MQRRPCDIPRVNSAARPSRTRVGNIDSIMFVCAALHLDQLSFSPLHSPHLPPLPAPFLPFLFFDPLTVFLPLPPSRFSKLTAD